MLLTTVTLLLALAFISWLIGQYFSYTGIGAIGAVLMIAAGGAIILTGLEVRTGAVKTIEHTTINNTTVANETTVEYRYKPVKLAEIFGVGILGSLGLGGILMLLGAAMLSQTLTEEM